MSKADLYTFLDFELDTLRHELRRSNHPVPLEPQVFDLICLLASQQGKLVTRDDILEAVWGGGIASDASISTRINAARAALGDSGKEQSVIKTVPRRGFVFLPEVAVHGDELNPHSLEVDKKDLERPSIAIMPFTVIGEDADGKALADGLRIDVQNALIKVSGLFLTAIGAANAASGFERAEATRCLRVDYFLTAQVRRLGPKMRVSFQLERAASGAIEWSQSFDGPVDEAFELLDGIVAKVLTALNVKLVSGEVGRVWHKTFKDLDALEIFYRGVSHFFEMTAESLILARQEFEKIAAKYADSPIGATWVSLTHWYDFQRNWGADRATSGRLAREWATKATGLEDHDGQACTVLSHVHLIEGNFEAALSAGESAVRNRPNCAHANGFYANVLFYCGDQPKAAKHIDLAIRHAPIHPPIFSVIKANILRMRGEREPSRALVTSVLARVPNDLDALVLKAVLAVELDDQVAAKKVADKLEQVAPDLDFRAYLDQLPFRDRVEIDRLKRALRSAGIVVVSD